MKKKAFFSILMSFLAAFLAACGSDSGSASGAGENSGTQADLSAATFDELPNCSINREGNVAYVEAEDANYVCVGKHWIFQEPPMDSVSTEDDLPACMSKREGDSLFVKSDEVAYVCTEGKWEATASTKMKSYETEDNLPNCSEKREGESALVEKDSTVNVCVGGAWVNLGTAVANEDALQNCTAKREGSKVYELESARSLVCTEGKWVDGSSIAATSSTSRDDVTGSSSSRCHSESSTECGDEEPGSSSAKESSYTTVESSSAVVGTSSSTGLSSSSAGPKPAKGTCKALVDSVEKGGSVTWKAIRMSGTFVTYNWTFSDSVSVIATSKDSVPSVKFSKPGIYTATLVINKGTDSTSAEIACNTKLVVMGSKIEGCTCTNADSSTTLFYKSGSPASSTWKVSGCKNADGSAANFTYAWSGDATGTGTSATGSFEKEGSFSPKVTVTNADGSTATPTCPSIKMEPLMSMTCAFSPTSVIPGGTAKFNVSNISGWTDAIGTNVSMVLSGNGKTQDITVNRLYNGGFNVVAPTAFDTYTYTLSARGIDICTAKLTVAVPKVACNIENGYSSTNSNLITVVPGQSVKFMPNGSGNPGWSNTEVPMMLIGEGVSKEVSVWGISNNSSTTFTAPQAFGSYVYKLLLNEREVCSATVTVAVPKVACNLGKDGNSTSSSSYSAAPGQSVAFMPDGSGNSWWLYNQILSMEFTGEGVSETLFVRYNKSDNRPVSFHAPNAEGVYPYKLSLNGTEVCSATLTVAYPKITASSCGFAKENWGSGSKSVTLGPGQPNWFISPKGWSGWDVDALGPTLKMLFVGEEYNDSVSISAYNAVGLKQVTAPIETGMYTYKIMYGGNEVCSATINVVDPVSCSASKTTINEGESFEFSTPYASGGSCSSATTKENGNTLTRGCKSSQTITPPKAGSFTYTYSASGSYGTGECFVNVTVNEVAPTCSVSDMMQTKGASFDVNPSSAIGCNNTYDGCSYSLTLSGDEKLGGTGYNGGKFTDKLVGETGTVGDTISAKYVLSLTNGTGTGTCGFTVTYIDTIEVDVTNSFESYDAGKIYKVTRNSTSGALSFKCKANVTSSKVAGVIGTTTLTISDKYLPSNGLTLETGTPYVFVTDVDAPSEMTCGLSF